jgi:hypothetical protein
MNDPQPIDLSPLDPGRDPRHWSLLVEATRVRVGAALLQRSRERDPLAVVGGWARPILAAAAVLVMLLGAAGTLLGGPAAPGSTAHRLALLAEASAVNGRAPTGAQLVAALRADRP